MVDSEAKRIELVQAERARMRDMFLRSLNSHKVDPEEREQLLDSLVEIGVCLVFEAVYPYKYPFDSGVDDQKLAKKKNMK